MILLPLQWEKHSGPDSVGQHKLIFTMDESINHGEFNPMSIKKGTQFLVMMIEAEEQPEFASETKEETLVRFRKQMHALLGEIAVMKGTNLETEKSNLKASLISSGMIKQSTTELTINDLATVIIRLKKQKHGQ